MRIFLYEEVTLTNMIELGGKIFLEGFEVLDQAELLVVKKLVGSYVRMACDKADCQQADLLLERVADGYRIVAKAKKGSEVQGVAEATGKNVFMAIDAAMKNLLQELKIE